MATGTMIFRCLSRDGHGGHDIVAGEIDPTHTPQGTSQAKGTLVARSGTQPVIKHGYFNRKHGKIMGKHGKIMGKHGKIIYTSIA